MRTCSRAIFSHFEGVAEWSYLLEELGASARAHPFPCDTAAFHHVLDHGWMWILRFDGGVTSAGFSLKMEPHPDGSFKSPEDEWAGLLRRYPTLGRQFADARPIRPLIKTDRLQRSRSPASGADWAALPHSVAFVDPWLSPGIAHALYAVARLARILAESWRTGDRASRLSHYNEAMRRELAVIDRITEVCFARIDCFPVLTSLTMLYFAAVTFAEGRARAGLMGSEEEFLLAHDPCFRNLVDELASAALRVSAADAPEFAGHVARRLGSYNRVGLCNPDLRNMYPYTP